MLTMLLALASIGDWVPMRWPSVDPSTLLLLRGTPVNCLLVNKVSVEFTESAKSMGVAVLLEFSKEGVVVDGPDKAKRAGMAGMVIAGARTEFLKSLDSKEFHVLSLPARYDLAVLPDSKLVGTWQGVWPGINQIDAADKAKAAPSGAPWIDTNSGFLRFVRAWTKAPVWIANRPPEKQVINPVRYLQAIADAAMCGARWVITLDSDLEQRLMTREVKAMQAWQRIGTLLTYIEVNKQWKNYLTGGKLAVIQDSSSGALLSSGILDMIAVKHTPAQPVPYPRSEE